MNKMQQQAMNTAPSTPLNLVSTEQIQKYLDENKNLIMAILECQKTGKVAECAQYQAVLQKNLMYLAAIADAQPPPPDSSKTSQPPTNSVPPGPQGDSRIPQTQASPMQQQQQQQASGPRMPFQLNALRPEQQNQLLQYQQQQQQLQGHFALGGNNGMHMLMHPIPGGGGGGGGGMMDLRGSQSMSSGVLDPSSGGDAQGTSALRRVEGRD